MAVPTNTHVEAAAVGVREDLEDSIYRVANEETPFLANIAKGRKAKSTMPEWQIEDLATADPNNANLEGDDASIDAAHTTERISVYAQIFDKTGSVSGTLQAADRAGREDTRDEQEMIKGLELKKDMHARFIGNHASRAESGSNARHTAGALAWIEDNDDLGATGASGGWASAGVVSAATNGTQRTFAESQIKGVVATGFNNGARFSQAYMNMIHKQQFGAFSGLAENRVTQSEAKAKVIVGAADVYLTDTGKLTLIPVSNEYLTRDCLLIDPSGWCKATYRGMKSSSLAKTGDNDKFQIVTEVALICKNQRKGAAVRDLS